MYRLILRLIWFVDDEVTGLPAVGSTDFFDDFARGNVAGVIAQPIGSCPAEPGVLPKAVPGDALLVDEFFDKVFCAHHTILPVFSSCAYV